MLFQNLIVLVSTFSLSLGNPYCNFTFNTESSRGRGVFVFNAGENAKLTLTIRCEMYRSYEAFDVYWTSADVSDIPDGVRFYRIYWQFDYFLFSRRSNVDGVGITEEREYTDEGSLNFTFQNINASFDGSRISVVDGYRTGDIVGSQQIIVVCCTVLKLPTHLVPVDTSKECFTDASLTCESGSLFISGSFYLPHTLVTCSTNSEWDLPDLRCLQSCPRPSFSSPWLSVTSKLQARSIVGTRVDLLCTRGHMHRSKAPKYLVSSSSIECMKDGTWTDHGVECWTGELVDFSRTEVQLISGIETVFYCLAKDNQNNVRLTLGQDVIVNEKVVWESKNMTSQYHDVIATCEEMLEYDYVIKKIETKLHVLFSPELISDNLDYELQKGISGEIVIRFRSNPAVTMSNIRVIKNGTAIQNIYLTTDGDSQTVVVDFIQVEDGDFGVYTMTIKSYTPVVSILTKNFTISESIPPTSGLSLQPGDIVAIGISVVVAIALITVMLLYIKKKLCGNNERKKITTTTNDETVVTYEADTHNYEDIDKDQTECSNTGYEIAHIRTTALNTYHIGSPTNERPNQLPNNPKIPMKPPQFEESPYMYNS